jgi:IclR family pca regulon transcriptional regulator
MGRTLLAHASPEEQREAIDAAVENGASQAWEGTREGLTDELRKVSQKGFAIADQVHVEGQMCVAAPLKSRGGEVIAAVEVAAVKSVFSRQEVLERLVPLVVASAAETSKRLGWVPSR